jgi:cytochrome P450 family 6
MILTLILVSLLTLYVYIKSRNNFWQNRGFPSSAKAKFLWGNFDGVGRSRSTAQALKALYDEHSGKEDFIGFYLLISPAVLIIDPELVKMILVKDFASFSDRGMYYNKRDDPLSANLVSNQRSLENYFKEA